MTPFGKVLLRACDNPLELVVVAIIILSAVPVVFGPHSSRGDEQWRCAGRSRVSSVPNKLLRKIPHHRGASMQAYHITSTRTVQHSQLSCYIIPGTPGPVFVVHSSVAVRTSEDVVDLCTGSLPVTAHCSYGGQSSIRGIVLTTYMYSLVRTTHSRTCAYLLGGACCEIRQSDT